MGVFFNIIDVYVFLCCNLAERSNVESRDPVHSAPYVTETTTSIDPVIQPTQISSPQTEASVAVTKDKGPHSYLINNVITCCCCGGD